MSLYDFKVFEYKYGTQIRMYQRPIETKDKVESNIKKPNFIITERKPREISNRSCKDPKESIKHSQNRSKNVIYQIARSNEWEWFITLTLSPNIATDRFDYDKSLNDISKWLKDIKKVRAPDLKYLLVPEQHEDGGWHFHGLFSNIGDLLFLDSGHTTKTKEGGKLIIYNICDYVLGFSYATKVYKPENITGYVTKYMTKELSEQTFNKKRYLASRNCEKPNIKTIYKGDIDKACFLSENIENISKLKDVNIDKMNTITYIELKQGVDYE